MTTTQLLLFIIVIQCGRWNDARHEQNRFQGDQNFIFS